MTTAVDLLCIAYQALSPEEQEVALRLPSAGPFRRRWRTWEKAFLCMGYGPDEVAERLDRSQGAREIGQGLTER